MLLEGSKVIYFLERFHEDGRQHRNTQELKNQTFLI